MHPTHLEDLTVFCISGGRSIPGVRGEALFPFHTFLRPILISQSLSSTRVLEGVLENKGPPSVLRARRWLASARTSQLPSLLTRNFCPNM